MSLKKLLPSKKRLLSAVPRSEDYTIDPGQGSSEIAVGKKNFIIFQKHPGFRWPGWVNSVTSPESPGYRPFIYPALNNFSMRGALSFSNYISPNSALIDPSGMLYTSYSPWSIEIWILVDGTLYRPSGNLPDVRVTRSVPDGMLLFSFENKLFSVDARLYGGRTSSDEAFFSINTVKRTKKDAYILAAIRPYNAGTLGGIRSIEFNPEKGGVAVNGRRDIIFPVSHRDFYIVKNGKDIDPSIPSNFGTAEDKTGMASFAASYSIEPAGTEITLRISLDSGSELEPHRVDFDSAEKIFIDHHSSLINKGMNLTLKDNLFKEWFYALKSTVLNFRYNEIRIRGISDFKRIKEQCSAVWALSRMGYTIEAINIYEEILSSIDIKNIPRDIRTLAGVSWILKSAADIFLYTRDVEFISGKRDRLSRLASYAHAVASKIRGPEDLKENTIEICFIPEGHLSDLIPAAAAFEGYSYIARTLGLFGEELKFAALSKKVQKILLEHTEIYDPDDEFFYNYVFSGFPFQLSLFTGEKIKDIMNAVRNLYGENRIFVKSAGSVSAAEISMAVNGIISGSRRGVDKVFEIMSSRQGEFQVPALYSSPGGLTLSAEPNSIFSSSLLFGALKTMLFHDIEERLIFFPFPVDSWFRPGKKFSVSSAPSRYGLLSFSVVCTEQEVHITFDDIPKFIPPEIVINLPFDAGIVPGDDFLVKKEINSTFVINGWPPLVRFARKKRYKQG